MKPDAMIFLAVLGVVVFVVMTGKANAMGDHAPFVPGGASAAPWFGGSGTWFASDGPQLQVSGDWDDLRAAIL